MRQLPRVGDTAEIVHLATTIPATIVAVDGATIEVATADGARQRFELHPRTGHFVRAGDPYWGVRLRLS